jgi:hypothetical protein
MASEITLEELSEAMARVIDDLKRKGVSRVTIDERGYLHINMTRVLDVFEQPQISLGDYDEDVETIRYELEQQGPVSYNYIQSLASLIQYLGIRPPGKDVEEGNQSSS